MKIIRPLYLTYTILNYFTKRASFLRHDGFTNGVNFNVRPFAYAYGVSDNYSGANFDKKETQDEHGVVQVPML